MFRVEPDRGMQKNYTGWSDNSEIAHLDQKVFEKLGIKRTEGAKTIRANHKMQGYDTPHVISIFFTQLVLKRIHV